MTLHQQTRRRFLQVAGLSTALSLTGSRDVLAAPATAPSDKTRPLFPLGLASYSLRKFDLDATLEMTRRVGLTHICFKSFHLPLKASAEEIADTVSKVKAAGLKLYGGGVIQMSDVEQVDKAFEYARAAGMDTIVGVPAPDVLQRVNEKVKEYDIRVAIHNHGPGDKVYPTPESAYRKIEKLDPRVGLCIDVGHTIRIGADPVRDVKRFADRLHDVHLKDVTEAAPGGKNVEVGRGVIDIPALLETLVKIGYGRVASFEYEKDADDPLPGLAESVGYVRGVLAVIRS